MKKLSLFIAMFLILVTVTPALAGTKVDGNQVTFTCKAPEASRVYLSGTFNGWSPSGEKMTQGTDGVWSVTITLKPGTYQYKFVVDGIWTPDLEAANLVDDGFSGKNAVLIVTKAAAGGDNARLDALEAKLAALEQSQGGFQFSGYARSGFIIDEDGKQITSDYQVSNAWSKYRLGNESDTFIENTLSKRWAMDDGSWAKVTFLWAHKDHGQNNVWENSNEDGNDAAVLRQSYVELGNLPELNNLTFWAGRRYYRRDDIHLTDFYWKDFSGIGAGVQGIGLGDANLDLALMFHGSSSNYAVSQLVLTMTGLKAGPGTFEFDLAPTYQKEDSAGDSGYGTAFAAKYGFGDFFGLSEGNAFIGVYYGDSVAYNPSWYGPEETLEVVEDEELIRLVASGVSQLSDNFEIQPVLVYQKQENTATDKEITWKSVGFRPVYHFNKNFALQFETGYDTTEEKNGGSTSKDSGIKYTLAPTFTLDKGYYFRPQVRAFVSRYEPKHDDAYTTFGVQMEVWW